MGLIRRILGYGTLGAAKVAAERALRSDEYIESSLSAAEAGLLLEAAAEFLSDEPYTDDEADYP
ncbi:MAG: hypothetical protein HY788_17705 [Deltaproteobacteria bacterium]|nr:hypothetical protein [Deltaproteobacteria bacterium]